MLVTVEIIHDGAIDLLSDMERLELIKVNIPNKTNEIRNNELSKQFAGALHLSDAAYEKYQNDLREGRNEWRKGIY